MKISRKTIYFSFVYMIIPLIALVAGYSFVSAQVANQVQVTATVASQPPIEEPDTIVAFQGIAYPNSTITLSQDGAVRSVISTTAQAAFEVSLIVDPGTYTFSIVGLDENGVEGRTSNFTMTLTSGTTTTISGIFLGPTISADQESITTGETVTLNGTTAPNSEVNVTLTSPVFGAAAEDQHIAVNIASADTNGRWLQLYNANDLVTGTHEAKAQAIEPIDGNISEFSNSVFFDVDVLDPCSGSLPGDINCDGFVDLVDFSILIFYWNTSNPANPRADINSDGIVDLTDFSIMLFYWTG